MTNLYRHLPGAPPSKNSALYGLFHLGVWVLCCGTLGADGGSQPDAGQRGIVVESTRKLPGLGETVQIVKAPGLAYAERASGIRTSLPELWRAERTAQRLRFGPLAPALHAALNDAPPGEPVRVAIYFRPDLEERRFSARLFSSNKAIALAARIDLRQAITTQGAALERRLEALGLTVHRRGESMPVLFAEGPPTALFDLAAFSSIQLVTSNTPLPMEHRGAPPASLCIEDGHVDPVEFHRIDVAFNDAQYFGDGQRIGIVEDVGDCTLLDDHEAFLGRPVVYSNPEPNDCINAHATSVASVISPAHDGLPRGAALATLYYPNTGAAASWLVQSPYETATQCSPQGTLDAYEWLLAQNVLTVNESFGCLLPSIYCGSAPLILEGVTQDYFARVYGMLIMKAAGNQDCRPDQPACPLTLNSLCVGAVGSDRQLACTSSTVNYSDGGDREEPDVMALGGESMKCGLPSSTVCTAYPANPQMWAGRSGTSYSAPAVTAMIALFRERCEQNWGSGPFDQRFLRAVARTAAWGHNPKDFAYSTPVPDEDWADGGGLLLADSLMEFCGPGGNGTTGGGSITIDLEDGESGKMPPGDAPYQGGWDPPGQTQSDLRHRRGTGQRRIEFARLDSAHGPGAERQRIEPVAFEYKPGPGSGRRWMELAVFDGLAEGSRVRATFSWDGCGIESGLAPTKVTTDFDLFLYNDSANRYVWASQSLDDSNEGFDYTVQAGEEGDYRLILAWPEGSVGCEGGSNEPGGYAWKRF